MDRRRECRYSAEVNSVVLSWIECGAPVEHSVQLVDISMQGCLVNFRVAPRTQPGERVWLTVPGVNCTPVIDGVVVSAVKPFLRKCSIRIRFLAPLPFQTFKMLVYGGEGVDLNVRDRPDHENDQFWK
jgi:hypothetical protein